ncbi:hypothetical protein R1sor_020253 [Riccia sorocarpa]|uniref:Vacuole membrane protein 1 n=1 Tax=Riccia sorocarpa TaxID=122646 RepID=A0ABD3IFI4_9MARC
MDVHDVATTSEQHQQIDPRVQRLKHDHAVELENLTLTKRPAALLKYFAIAVFRQVGSFCHHVAHHQLSFVLIITLICIAGASLYAVDGPHEIYVKESLAWARYVVWWVALGVASSIGLGSGLHTFILYLGPHVTAFTMRATECGRVDFKSSPYDTPQWGLPSTWALKDCSQLGAPQYPLLASHHSERYMVPLHTVLMQVQLEAVLWGIGTALGELPPYFVSRAARLSGEKPKELDEELASTPQSFGARTVQNLKLWMVNHFENFGFFTILLLASVPNPMFDLAGILCGQFLVPFWKFFAATIIGKAIIKTHIQTIFIIMACNPYVLELVGDGLTWVLKHLPAVQYLSPNMIDSFERAKVKLNNSQSTAKPPPEKSFAASAWNTIVLMMMAGFLSSIVTSAAQNVLKEKQNYELKAFEARLRDMPSNPTSIPESSGR